MRRLVLSGVAIAIAITGSVLAATARRMSVQVRDGQVRSAPAFLSRVLTTVPYTEQVSVLEEKGDWSRVQTGTIEGWMHKTSLTSTKLKLSGDGADAKLAVSTEETALSGKGFNSDVEKQFKERNEKVDFADVDKMEKIKIPVETVLTFLNDGNVHPAEGGAR